MKNFKCLRNFALALSLLSIGTPLTLQGQNSYSLEIKAIAEKLSSDVNLAQKKRVAVIDFTDLEGNITALGRFIAEKLSIALFKTKREFDLVNRSQLARLIKENKLAEEGLLNPKTVARLGQLAGVDAIIIGTLTPFGDNIEYSFSTINIESATVIAAIDGQFPKTNAMNSLLGTALIKDDELSFSKGTGTSSKIDTSQTHSTSLRKLEKEDILFELVDYRLTGAGLEFDLLITSLKRDERVTFSVNESRILDDLGGEHDSVNGTFGNSSSRGQISKTLVPEVKTKAGFQFNTVLKGATSIALFEIKILIHGKNWDTVRFKDLPLSGKNPKNQK
jgi:hypothetical protein